MDWIVERWPYVLYTSLGSLYAVNAHPKPASPCRNIPCIPSPGVFISPHLLFHAFAVAHPSTTITQPDPIIVGLGNLRPSVPVYHTLGFGSITPLVTNHAYRGDPLGRIYIYRRLLVVNPW